MSILVFPNPVDEVSARLVAGAVVILSLTAVATGSAVLTALITCGFILRVMSGPRFSPLGLLVTKVVRPKLSIEPRSVAGPPKRFAQGVGVVFSLTATVLLLLGSIGAAQGVLLMLAIAATLESVFGLCLGCKVFAGLMKLGIIPEEVCERCNNIGLVGGPQA